jgi:hypothetical protein
LFNGRVHLTLLISLMTRESRLEMEHCVEQLTNGCTLAITGILAIVSP